MLYLAVICGSVISSVISLSVIHADPFDNAFSESVQERSQADPNPGFALLFSTNLEEVSDTFIHFDKPLPLWLRGTLIRNGLGRFEVGRRNVTHAFDGFSKLCSWKFYGNGSATFSTKFLMSEFYNTSLRENDIAPYLLFEGVVPAFNEIQKMQALLHGIDNMNVNIYDFYNADVNRSEYMAVNDFWKVYQIDPHTLGTVGPVQAPLPSIGASRGFAFLSFLSSSHPLPESGTLNHVTYVSSVSLLPGIKNIITVVRIKSGTDREAIASWGVDKLPYMHSFSVTEHFVIFFAIPFYVNVLKMLRYAEPIRSLDWFANENTTVYVVNIKTGSVQTLKTENIFCMHHINAYETSEGKIVVDLATYDNPDFVKDMEMAILRDVNKRNNIPANAMIKRYVIDLAGGVVVPERFVSTPAKEYLHRFDMPTINEKYRFAKYCFVYGIVMKADNVHLNNNTLVKVDVCRPHNDKAWYMPNHYPMEAWFVQTPGGQDEDDGYLMTPILDGVRRISYLAIIDAKTMTIVNKADLPTIVPFTLHGRFFPDVL